MKCSQEGLELIKKFEGCRLEAYRCSANVLTIGYGHTGGVLETDVITQDVADKLLKEETITESPPFCCPMLSIIFNTEVCVSANSLCFIFNCLWF